MLTLVNTNRVAPPIAPVGLDYLAGALRDARIDFDVLDLGLVDDPQAAIERHFAERRPDLVAVSFRNVDDCFWPGGAWFVPDLRATVAGIRRVCDAPIVVGGVGYSIFARPIAEYAAVDFGIQGDGEQALVRLLAEIRGPKRFDRVPGLVWRHGAAVQANPAALPRELPIAQPRDTIDNAAYFRLGGQIGIETKRGCNRRCIYCPEPRIKGSTVRLRSPVLVADEFESLLAQGVDVVHLCDSEFNLPILHARAVCEELIRRRLGERIRWYAYLTVTPFDAELARQMRRAGCVGINFTGDAASPAMLATYRQPHGADDLARTVRLCRENGIRVMVDLLFGGPGETPATVEESIRSIQRFEPDCAGAALGIRLYPQTAVETMIRAEGPWDANPNVHRRYAGPIDLLKPTFYVSADLGDEPARLVREIIGGDPRFFEPADESPSTAADAESGYNYNENRVLADAIAGGARGAYWDILSRLRTGT